MKVPRKAEAGRAGLVAGPPAPESAQLTLDQLAIEEQGALVRELVLARHGQADRSDMDVRARDPKMDWLFRLACGRYLRNACAKRPFGSPQHRAPASTDPIHDVWQVVVGRTPLSVRRDIPESPRSTD